MIGPEPLRLRRPVGHAAETSLRDYADAAWAVNGNAERALALAVQLSGTVPRPGAGHTVEYFEVLATLACCDLTAARVAEAHLDALAIVYQAGLELAELVSAEDAAVGTWGVFAAESGGTRLTAEARTAGGEWRLSGTKPWCSLAGTLSYALVSAHVTASSWRLFAVSLRDPGVIADVDTWISYGLRAVPSGPVHFGNVPAVPVGGPDWYLTRPGFAWGGIGVAACWWGGAVGLARQVWAAAMEKDPDQIAAAHVGALDVALTAARTSLIAAAEQIDAGTATGADGVLLAARVRGLIARAVEDVIARTGHALGPAPLAFDARHAQRVADLQLYVRQHHAERDDAALGRRLIGTGVLRW